MKKDKGQSLVELTQVLPFFLFLVFAIIYCGMLFHDYSALSSIARSAAREAAIEEKTDSTTYGKIAAFYEQQTQNTLTTLYRTRKVNVEHKEKTVDDKTETFVVVRPTFDIVYFMKKDTPASNTNTNSQSGNDG